MAKLEDMDADWKGQPPNLHYREVKKPFLQLRAEFIRKWGGSSSQLGQELDELLREYLRMMAT
jgi:hypothetical protein